MFIFFWFLSPCESRAISVFISLINLICKAYDYLCVDPEAWIDTERSPNWEPRVRHIRLHNEKNSFHSEHSLMIALHTFVSSFLSPSVNDSMRLYKNREIWAWTTAIWMDVEQPAPDSPRLKSVHKFEMRWCWKVNLCVTNNLHETNSRAGGKLLKSPHAAQSRFIALSHRAHTAQTQTRFRDNLFNS